MSPSYKYKSIREADLTTNLSSLHKLYKVLVEPVDLTAAAIGL